MMGSGKSTVGKLLAHRLNYQFFDTDQYIEEKTGRKIPEIIRTDGYNKFAELELSALLAAPIHQCIVSTGGKTYLDKKCREFIDKTGKIAFLNVTLEEIEKRLTPEEIAKRSIQVSGKDLTGALDAIRKERFHIYRSGPAIEVDGVGTPDQICDRILGGFADEKIREALSKGIKLGGIQEAPPEGGIKEGT